MSTKIKVLETIDRWMLWVLNLSILAEVILNFIDSYGHVYVLGLKYGEYGVDARTIPVAIDLLLTCLAIANVFAARYDRRSPWLRRGLVFGVGATVVANAAYGASWGITGGLLSMFAPVALFITVECGLFVFRLVADLLKEAREEAAKAAAPKLAPWDTGALPFGPVAGPSIETMQRIQRNLPAEGHPAPRPSAPEPEGKGPAPIPSGDRAAWERLNGIGTVSRGN